MGAWRRRKRGACMRGRRTALEQWRTRGSENGWLDVFAEQQTKIFTYLFKRGSL